MCVSERKTDREWKSTSESDFHQIEFTLCDYAPGEHSSVDWIAVVTARSVLFPAELMKVGSRHQAESKPRISEKMQKPVYHAISQSNM